MDHTLAGRPLDETLLRRFGVVRAFGGAAYIVGVGVLYAVLGASVWPLALGVPVLGVVTTLYFRRSGRYPRTLVIVSLAADAVVLCGAVSFLGGTGSGLVLLYAIVVVSAGILLGPGAATGFTALCVGLGLLQLAAEELGYPPVLLHRPDLSDRLPILLVSLAGLISIGYLSATYASRLHELIAEADAAAASTRARGERRRAFVTHTADAVQQPLRQLESAADALDDMAELDEAARARLSTSVRMGVVELGAEIGKLTDIGVMDELADARPRAVSLSRVVDDCLTQLGARLDGWDVTLDVPAVKVLADPRGTRRVVYALLENVVDHTPPGTAVRVRALAVGGHGVLAVTDDGPGIPSSERSRLFESDAAAPRVGLPLVHELCEAMGAEVRFSPPRDGGARVIVAFRLAPSAAPEPGDTTNRRAARPAGTGPG